MSQVTPILLLLCNYVISVRIAICLFYDNDTPITQCLSIISAYQQNVSIAHPWLFLPFPRSTFIYPGSTWCHNSLRLLWPSVWSSFVPRRSLSINPLCCNLHYLNEATEEDWSRGGGDDGFFILRNHKQTHRRNSENLNPVLTPSAAADNGRLRKRMNLWTNHDSHLLFNSKNKHW